MGAHRQKINVKTMVCGGELPWAENLAQMPGCHTAAKKGSSDHVLTVRFTISLGRLYL